MTSRDVRTLLIGLVVFASLAAYSATHMRVSSDITHFLPSSDDRQLAEISKQLTESRAVRTMILSVEAPDATQAAAAAQELAFALRANHEVTRCQSGPDSDFGEAAYSLLFGHRFQLYSDHPAEEVPRLLSEEGLANAANTLKEQLTLPTASLVKRIAPADPLLLFPAILRRLSRANTGSLQVIDGQFVTADGKHGVLFLETRDSPFDGPAQRPFLEFVHQTFDKLNAAHGGTLQLEMSGLNRFAVASEKIIRADINRISTLSTVAAVVMFLLLFRSIWVLMLSFIPLVCALVAAGAASLAVFGEVHGLTLALGATLIGVCIDYPIYFLNHQALVPDPEGPQGNVRRIRGALILGMVTSIAGFAGLGWTSFPGMRELALFATAGIVAALAATLWILPVLSPRKPKQVRLHQRVADLLGGVLRAAQARPRLYVALVITLLIVCALGIPRARWSDDPNALNKVDATLQAEDEKVRAEVSRMDSGRFIIVAGDDEAQALALNDRVYEQLVEARAAHELDDFASLHMILFSPALQHDNLNAFQSAPNVTGRVLDAFAKAGFRPEAFAPFTQALTQASPEPLALGQLLKSPLADIVRPFTVDLGGRTGLISLVRGDGNPAALKARIDRIPGAHYFDQTQFLAQAYGHYRVRTMELIVVGVLVMILVVFLTYRRVRPAIAAALPAILASTATLALLGLFGVVMNLLHVVSLVLVLSAGEDYAIFLLARAKHPEEMRASAVGVVLCCLSAVLAFGLLGLSAIPALQALGVTIAIGLFLSLLLAPLALVIAPQGSEK